MLWHKKSSFNDLLKKNSLKFKNKHNNEYKHTRKCYTLSCECFLITHNEHTKSEGTIVEICNIKREKKRSIYKVTHFIFMTYIFKMKKTHTFLYYK